MCLDMFNCVIRKDIESNSDSNSVVIIIAKMIMKVAEESVSC